MKKKPKEINHWLDPNNLKREEIRGIFAIGALAAFYSIRSIIQEAGTIDVPNVGPISTELVHATINVLLFCWSSYIFLMTISISSDILSPTFTSTFFSHMREYAYTFFKIGAVTSLFLFSLIFLFLALQSIFLQRIVLLFVLIYAISLIWKRIRQVIKR